MLNSFYKKKKRGGSRDQIMKPEGNMASLYDVETVLMFVSSKWNARAQKIYKQKKKSHFP